VTSPGPHPGPHPGQQRARGDLASEPG